MNSKGWISLHRQMQNHWLWDDKPFSKGQAWMDLLMMANHQENKFLLGNELIKVERGSFVTSELKMIKRWGWSKTKLRNFFKLLEEDEMIMKKTDKKKTILTICNYNEYQTSENHKETMREPQENQVKTTKKPQENTNNNDNNENKDNKDRSICQENEAQRESQLKFPLDSIEYRLADFLRKWIKKNNELAKVPGDSHMDKWSQHIDYMLRLDNRSAEDIKEVIEFCQKDEFWMTNILSTAKLRNKFDQLYLKSRQKNQPAIHPVNTEAKIKTKFHLSKSRGDKYTADELEERVLGNQKERLVKVGE
ncbi:phage protein [Alkaliphilus metalliredigens QYMF]|uniref:Phage protein n=1 Tax=Alkaliphilus metalliredigens (strain QYMF) TaxID=293826 RepID=A6TLJ9_ALKMQ|nr:hypothetical protein [Alkaliphilus metalliredigens]ABR47067.1 phage protein [Alkaliphilus metalliredigens QYMF]